MIYLVIILLIVTVVLAVDIYIINKQLKRMNSILERRLNEETCQVVSIDLINPHITKLASSINECLKTEETLRLNSVKEEKKYKEIMANISHDLRTPLTAIKGYQQMLEKEPLTEEQHSKLNIAMKHTENLGKLIEQFFEYAYMVNYAPKCNLQKINLTNLVAECLADAITIFEEHGMKVEYDDSIQAHVIADKELLGRIIQNLIRNCVQHGVGLVLVKIIINKRNEESAMVGISFSNKIIKAHNIDVDKLFDRFYTSDNARKKSTGLGLTIVKILTEQMNGKVSAEISNGMLNIKTLFPLAH